MSKSAFQRWFKIARKRGDVLGIQETDHMVSWLAALEWAKKQTVAIEFKAPNDVVLAAPSYYLDPSKIQSEINKVKKDE